jgi:hypothetical protein
LTSVAETVVPNAARTQAADIETRQRMLHPPDASRATPRFQGIPAKSRPVNVIQ